MSVSIWILSFKRIFRISSSSLLNIYVCGFFSNVDYEAISARIALKLRGLFIGMYGNAFLFDRRSWTAFNYDLKFPHTRRNKKGYKYSNAKSKGLVVMAVRRIRENTVSRSNSTLLCLQPWNIPMHGKCWSVKTCQHLLTFSWFVCLFSVNALGRLNNCR